MFIVIVCVIFACSSICIKELRSCADTIAHDDSQIEVVRATSQDGCTNAWLVIIAALACIVQPVLGCPE
ncbi:hypothetical protein PF005_g3805 [Phytophthora fragariae]|uniref:Uncharacterized protein n=1 Tax=Phytophthora fragariae TaxID=53985 RepID=A0A6A3M1V3_9STRA|nr:hypothetical protein PF003_g31170 [Phytophthora fragariae]KAE8946415.1 hypothetical protein PF009_g3963 [Phytophthora fragariae]KAE9025432.1 hypothetical protein PF011_g3026 [Phytophthora fragariae]KAE9131821.1 hypothetical protein PF010_g3404 [Phytophthora fragariae]KAE9132453.1 hypothetical protein PF007_g3716 [Phytophthora fragariae]